MIEKFIHNNDTFAIIVRKDFNNTGINFFTPNDYSQQLAYMSHPVGKEIQPHIHKKVQREVNYTQETLFIRKGKLQVMDSKVWRIWKCLKSSKVPTLAMRTR
jgi:hypothetical protein